MNDKTLSIIIQAKDQASKVMDGVGERASAMASAVGAASKLAATALVAGGVAAAGFAVKSAASFEQTRIGLENMLGSADSARNVLKQVSQFAASTPFEFPELAASVKQLVAFGFSGVDAIKTMKQLGDVSSAIGAPIGDLSYLMGTLRAQGRAFTVDIRQFAQRGVPIYEYLAKVLHTNTEELNGMIEAGKVGFPEVSKAFEMMTAEGGKFHGAMAKQSQSLSGLWSTLKDNIGLAGREMIGISQEGDVKQGSVFDRLRIAAAGLITELDKIDWAQVSAKAMDMASSVVTQLENIGSHVIDLGVKVVAYLTPAFQSIEDVIRSKAIPAVQDFLGWYAQLNPVLQVAISPLTAVIANFNSLRDFAIRLKDSMVILFDTITTSTAFIVITQFLQQVMLPAFDAVRAAVVQNLLPALGQLWDAFTRLWNALNPGLIDVLKVIAGIVAGSFLLAWVGLLTALNLVIQVFSIVVSAISNLINWIGNLISWFGNLVGIVVNTVASIGTIFRNLLPAIGDVIGIIGAMFGGLGGMILRSLGNLGSLLYNSGLSLIDGLVKGIRDGFAGIGSSITGGIKGALHAAHIPGFASGGFTGPGGVNDVAGVVHKGEYVVPKSQVNQSTGLPEGVGSTFNMYGSINLGSAGAVDRFFERLDAQKEMGNLGVGI